MLTISGASHRLCDGVTRRDALRIGALGLGGLSLPGLLRAEHAAGITKSHKAVIMIYMVGAPPHQDMYDLKPDAPAEIRGEFRPIDTNVPGIQICEHLPCMVHPVATMIHSSVTPVVKQRISQRADGRPSGRQFPKFSVRSTSRFPRFLAWLPTQVILPTDHQAIRGFWG